MATEHNTQDIVLARRRRNRRRRLQKLFLILLVLLGWMGGHRYYEHRWVLGAIYTAFCWTGIPFAMCVIDAMIVIPKKADENGMITM